MVHIYNRIVLSHKKEYFLIFNHIYIKKIFFLLTCLYYGNGDKSELKHVS